MRIKRFEQVESSSWTLFLLLLRNTRPVLLFFFTHLLVTRLNKLHSMECCFLFSFFWFFVFTLEKEKENGQAKASSLLWWVPCSFRERDWSRDKKKERGKKKNKAVEASQCVRHAELLLCCPKANRAVFHSAHDLRRSCRGTPFFEVRHLNYTAEVC